MYCIGLLVITRCRLLVSLQVPCVALLVRLQVLCRIVGEITCTV